MTSNARSDRTPPGDTRGSGFDRLAGVYRLLEYLAFGPLLDRARRAHLDALRSASRVLVVGDGDGRCVAHLASIAPQAVIHCIDTSPAMLAAARRRIPADDHVRITFELADVRRFKVSADSWDAVLTMFVLDCLSEDDTREVIERLAAGLRPGGMWLWADFAEPGKGWQRLWGRLTIRCLYTFFRWTTGLEVRALPPAEQLLADIGLIAADERQWLAGLVRSVRYQRPEGVELGAATARTRVDGCRSGQLGC